MSTGHQLVYGDWLHKLVSYRCDPSTDVLSIYYDGAFNEYGKEMLDNAGMNDWDPWQLLEIKDDENGTRVIGIKSVTRTCVLSDGKYEVIISGLPGNMNIMGRCGVAISAHTEINKNGQQIFSGGFEGDCHMSSMVLTNIIVKPGQNLQLTREPEEEAFGW